MARKRVTKKTPQATEGQTLTTSPIKSNTVETVEAEVVVISANADEPKLFEGKKMYWAKTMHFYKEGIVEGIITNKFWDIFLETTPDDIDIYKWISSRDFKAERLAEVKRKMKAKIGLTE